MPISFFVNAFGFELVDDPPALTEASVASTTAPPTDARVVALVASRLLGHQNRGLVGNQDEGSENLAKSCVNHRRGVRRTSTTGSSADDFT